MLWLAGLNPLHFHASWNLTVVHSWHPSRCFGCSDTSLLLFFRLAFCYGLRTSKAIWKRCHPTTLAAGNASGRATSPTRVHSGVLSQLRIFEVSRWHFTSFSSPCVQVTMWCFVTWWAQCPPNCCNLLPEPLNNFALACGSHKIYLEDSPFDFTCHICFLCVFLFKKIRTLFKKIRQLKSLIFTSHSLSLFSFLKVTTITWNWYVFLKYILCDYCIVQIHKLYVALLWCFKLCIIRIILCALFLNLTFFLFKYVFEIYVLIHIVLFKFHHMTMSQCICLFSYWLIFRLFPENFKLLTTTEILL